MRAGCMMTMAAVLVMIRPIRFYKKKPAKTLSVAMDPVRGDGGISRVTET